MNDEWIAPGPLRRALLLVPGLLYGSVVRLRNRLYDAGVLPVRRLPCRVVAIGNLTAGGTGKTPLTSFVAGALRQAGHRVGVVSRGYGRAGRHRALLVSDGRRLLAGPEAAGDEPCLIARDNPGALVAVGADRVAAARLLVDAGAPEVVLLDDAFQNRRVARDLNVVLVDGRDPWGNGRMLPFGPLREPLSGLARADAVVITRGNGRCPDPLRPVLERYNPRVPLFHARISPVRFASAGHPPVELAALAGRSVYAFSAIARPAGFEADLRASGARIAGTRRFPDHHRYRAADLQAVVREARRSGADALVTTEKDLIRIAAAPEGAPPLFALALAVSFPRDGDLVGWLVDRLRDAGGAAQPRVQGGLGAGA